MGKQKTAASLRKSVPFHRVGHVCRWGGFTSVQIDRDLRAGQGP
jgi:hypothetical protein